MPPTNSVGLPLQYGSKEYRKQLTDFEKNNEGRTSQKVLWRPADPESTPISQYRLHVNKKFKQDLLDSKQLHAWTVQNSHDFWIDLYDYAEVIPPLPRKTNLAYNPRHKVRDHPPFFLGHRINYAENVLSLPLKRHPEAIALTGLRENQLDDAEHVTWAEVWEYVRLTRSGLVRAGIKKGDVVAAHMSNSIWIIVVFLATASIGALFTSISPDMGISGCVSRLTQVNPSILFSDIDFALRGVRHALTVKIMQIQRTFAELKLAGPKVVFVPTGHKPHLKTNLDYLSAVGMSLNTFLKRYSRTSDKLTFTRVEPSHPVVILYSSGTTGVPKCILSPHMSILNFKKVALLHNSLGPRSTVFQYSSTSWVVWNVMVGHFSVGARIVCYDGGALHPSPATLLQICAQEKVTYWGTSPRYLLELEQAAKSKGIDPRDFDLSSLRMVTTTGATLTGPQYRWFYTAFPSRVHLSSIAGCTEIATSWIASDPAGTLRENEMQMFALGHACDVVDPETGESLINSAAARRGQEQIGELVCRNTHPSQPVGFWNDPGDKRYHEAYFERFPVATTTRKTAEKIEYLDMWAQHDITTYNPRTGGLQITGRADSTLNPSGIRFGPSEIYSILSSPNSTLKHKISDALCVGRKRTSSSSSSSSSPSSSSSTSSPRYNDKDETVFLFLITQHEKPDNSASARATTNNDENPAAAAAAKGEGEGEGEGERALIAQVKSEISTGLSPRHVPKFIFILPAGGIPYTVNGKKVEVLVKRIISGDVVLDAEGKVQGKQAAGMVSTIVNPECLALYPKYRDVEREGPSAPARAGRARL